MGHVIAGPSSSSSKKSAWLLKLGVYVNLFKILGKIIYILWRQKGSANSVVR